MPGAYYNEHDPFAAAWLRELIKAGHIAPGEVDERDIREVQPDDVRGYRECHFFAGIGGWALALQFAAWPGGSVWTGSCPCQPFSEGGRGGGLQDERHLWPAWFRLIRECRPPVVFGEQSATPAGLAWLDAVSVDLEGEDYAVGAVDLCAASVGAPHGRQRLYFVGGRAGTDPHGRDGLQYKIGSDRDTETVVLEFGKSVRWIGMRPEHAEALAQALLKHAERARR
jgi:DNA (cytosine-5)-methyltransferase 1